MKKFLALVLALVMTMSLVTIGASAKTSFTDDSKITYTEAVEVLNAMGVLTGYADGSFRPQAVLTRGAGAKIIAYLMLGQTAADNLKATGTVFSDVPADYALAPYIEWAYAKGIVAGYGNGKFGPQNLLTEYAFGKMLLVALGYNAGSEGFNAAGWQKNVYAYGVRTNIGIFDGTETFGACTREKAAAMALAALKANVVVYGTANTVGGLYYYNGHYVAAGNNVSVTGAYTTEYALYSFYSGLSYHAAGSDAYGRPGHTWSYKTTFEKFYMDTPVLTYTKGVTACDILVDLGIAKTSTKSVDIEGYIVDGYNDTSVKTMSHANKACEAMSIGGQGTLTQVFKMDDDTYIVTVIHTYLAKITSVTSATHGGNLYSFSGYMTATLYGKAGTATVILSGTDYAKGDYILLNAAAYDNQYSYFGISEVNAVIDEEAPYHVDILGKAPVSSGTLDSYLNGSYSVISGTKYSQAEEYALGNPGTTKTNYNVYSDQYGNVIGLAVPSTVYSYGTIARIAWIHNGLATPYAQANLVFMDGTTAAGVTMYKDLGVVFYNSEENTTTQMDGEVSSNYPDNEESYQHWAIRFENTASGYVIAAYGDEADAKAIKNSQPTVVADGISTNDNTVYLVETLDASGNSVFTSYTGYKNVPSMTGVVISYFAEDGYVTYAYVNATEAQTGFTTELYTIFDAAADGASGAYATYKMYKGATSSVLPAAADGMDGFDGAGIYAVTTNSVGVITGIVPIITAGYEEGALPTGYALLAAAYCDGTDIHDNEAPTTSYNITAAVTAGAIYSVNEEGTVTAAAYADTVGHNVLCVLDSSNHATALYILPAMD